MYNIYIYMAFLTYIFACMAFLDLHSVHLKKKIVPIQREFMYIIYYLYYIYIYIYLYVYM